MLTPSLLDRLKHRPPSQWVARIRSTTDRDLLVMAAERFYDLSPAGQAALVKRTDTAGWLRDTVVHHLIQRAPAPNGWLPMELRRVLTPRHVGAGRLVDALLGAGPRAWRRDLLETGCVSAAWANALLAEAVAMPRQDPEGHLTDDTPFRKEIRALLQYRPLDSTLVTRLLSRQEWSSWVPSLVLYGPHVPDAARRQWVRRQTRLRGPQEAMARDVVVHRERIATWDVRTQSRLWHAQRTFAPVADPRITLPVRRLVARLLVKDQQARGPRFPVTALDPSFWGAVDALSLEGAAAETEVRRCWLLAAATDPLPTLERLLAQTEQAARGALTPQARGGLARVAPGIWRYYLLHPDRDVRVAAIGRLEGARGNAPIDEHGAWDSPSESGGPVRGLDASPSPLRDPAGSERLTPRASKGRS